MIRDPRAFGLPARHDDEFARLDRALAGIGESRASLERTAQPIIAEESIERELGSKERRRGAVSREVGQLSRTAETQPSPGFGPAGRLPSSGPKLAVPGGS